MSLRAADWPSDPLLGTTHYTVGLINGGVAPNVIPPNAEAEVFFRTVGDHAPLREMLHQTLTGRVEVQEILELPAVRMHTVPGFDTAVFSYFSDIPFLTNWGTPLLLGPGSIHVAHTDREHIAIDELNRAVDIYAKLASTCWLGVSGSALRSAQARPPMPICRCRAARPRRCSEGESIGLANSRLVDRPWSDHQMAEKQSMPPRQWLSRSANDLRSTQVSQCGRAPSGAQCAPGLPRPPDCQSVSN